MLDLSLFIPPQLGYAMELISAVGRCGKDICARPIFDICAFEACRAVPERRNAPNL